MSMGIGHFAFGASGTLVMIQILPLRVRLRIRIAQVFIVLVGGTWALFPDLSKHAQRLKFINVRYWTRLGLPNLDRFINLLSAFHDSRWANISFLHRALDIVDDTDSIVISSAFLVLMLVIVSMTLVREIRERKLTNAEEHKGNRGITGE